MSANDEQMALMRQQLAAKDEQIVLIRQEIAEKDRRLTDICEAHGEGTRCIQDGFQEHKSILDLRMWNLMVRFWIKVVCRTKLNLALFLKGFFIFTIACVFAHSFIPGFIPLALCFSTVGTVMRPVSKALIDIQEARMNTTHWMMCNSQDKQIMGKARQQFGMRADYPDGLLGKGLFMMQRRTLIVTGL